VPLQAKPIRILKATVKRLKPVLVKLERQTKFPYDPDLPNSGLQALKALLEKKT
jgi:hypothetical protein